MAGEVIQFADVTVDLNRVAVLRGGQPVALEPKTFDVLRYLLEHRDRLVTKEELLDTVWKDTFVTPNVLTRAIAQLRKALGDDAFQPRYIETAAKRGYRFVASVEIVQGHSGPQAPAPPVQPLPAGDTSEPAVRRHLPLLRFLAGLILVAGVVFFAYSLREAVSTEPREAATVSVPRRLTTGSESYSFPAISLDGRTIAYSVNRGGARDIYASPSTPGGREHAITADGGQNVHPAWSPDGQWLAYHSRAKGGIWIVPSSGGAPRQVIEFGSHPTWMPDSQRIVFTSEAGGMAASATLWSVHREGSDRRALTKLGTPRGGHSNPAVSPDGGLLAFTVSQGHLTPQIATVRLGDERVNLLGVGASPRFSPDGRSLYWASAEREVLLRATIDENGARVGEPDVAQRLPGHYIGGFSIARDGAAVLWLFRASANLWSADVSPRGAAPTPPRRLTNDDVRLTQPRHSNDGRIAFHQIAVGRPPTTWLIDEDGGNRQSLTTGLSFGVFLPQWSRDSKRLFVMVGGHEGKPSFAWLDTETRKLTPVAVPAHGVLSPSLSPDDREIAFHVIDANGVINVWRQPLEGGARRQITFDAEVMSYPAWSPDGSRIAVEIKRSDHTHIGVVSKDGGPVEMIVTEDGQSWPHSWSPDNEHIAFAGERGGVWNIYTVSTRTKQIRRITDFASVEGYVRYPSWSRTRPHIVFELAEQTGSLWTLELP